MDVVRKRESTGGREGERSVGSAARAYGNPAGFMYGRLAYGTTAGSRKRGISAVGGSGGGG